MEIPFPEPTFTPFRLGSLSHGLALAVVATVIVALLFWRPCDERIRRRVRYTLATVVVCSDLSWHTWFALTGNWTIQSMLPLQLCALTTYLSAAMLVTRSYRLYELCYFFGLGGASQALFTPDIPYDFPSPRFFANFIGHGAMVAAALYMTVVEGYRPRWASLGRAVSILAIYSVPIFFLNLALGANYMFIGRKPAAATPLDLLPPWPYYLPILAGLAIAACIILYLPYAISDALRARRGESRAALE